eukprot:TRINITY_DN2847_c0_g1_i1.p1 TRINITY_DN2847_c0_g1~~TRINITY_DN2847_c0_g1_i1.p1  ORF type:complete len:198 (-),score=59.27 TRINITY_DN2847_c0_g1_i1:36-629(-)
MFLIIKSENNIKYIFTVPEEYNYNFIKLKVERGDYEIQDNINNNNNACSKEILISNKIGPFPLEEHNTNVDLEVVRMLQLLEERKWKKIGKMMDWETLQNTYSMDEYEWGVKYNTNYARVVDVTTWNRGIRITIRHPYPQGDSTNMKYGTSTWKKETDDSKNIPGFLHKYVQIKDGIYEEYAGNGNNHNLDIYARRF